jgi:hypothetical protein
MAIQFLQDIDVTGEVQGTSLDINGNADISGNLTLSGDNPTITLNDSNGRAAAIDVVGNTFRIDDVGNNAAILTCDISGNPPNVVFYADVTVGDDLFMPSGGVINFNSGDVTMTHSSNQLEVNGGNFIVQSNIECNDLDIGGTATGDGSGLTDLDGSQITTGTVASARLDADTAHLTTTQTFSGSKTFSAAVTISNATASTTKTTGALKVSGGIGLSGALNAGGDVVAYASSDKRYKDNLQPITNPIDKVKSLTGYTFTWNDKHEQFNGNNDIGVVAQEVEKILPEIVDTRDNGYKAVKYEKMVALLIEAVKDQQKQIDELKEKCNGCSC